MADFELSEEYQDLSDTVRDFADNVVAPVSAKHDEEHSFPYEVVSQMADMGLFGLPFPEEHGGMGGDYFALALALEQLGRVDQSVAITLEAGVSLGAMPVYRFGTEAQKEEWLPLLASGKALPRPRPTTSCLEPSDSPPARSSRHLWQSQTLSPNIS